MYNRDYRIIRGFCISIIFLCIALSYSVVKAAGVTSEGTAEQAVEKTIASITAEADKAITKTASEANAEVTAESSEKNDSSKTKNNKVTTVTISAAGDCTLGVDSRYNSVFNSVYNEKGSSYFLVKLALYPET